MTDESGPLIHSHPAELDSPNEQEAVAAGPEAAPSAPDTLGAWLRRLFARRDETGSAARLEDLNRMIEYQPEAAVNYLFRGELRLKNADYENAAADFRRASDLAADEFDRADWGLVAQTLRDRALAGLQQAERRLTVKNAGGDTPAAG
jgi:tetratricopeptide (TPR) repeat protein